MTEQTTQVEHGHTPGPWKVGAYKNSSAARDSLAIWPGDAIEGIKGTSICLISPLDNVTQKDEANAFLIAAAPELLASLRGVLEALECGDLTAYGNNHKRPETTKYLIGEIGALIKKAEGK